MISYFYKKIKRPFLCALLLCFSFQIYAQKKDSITTPLSEIIITSILKDKKLYKSSENIQILTKENLEISDGLNYNQILNKVPGVFMQSGSLNTNRITIRGIGARSPFGTTSIRAYYGEIPLTDGNGSSTLENIELSSISSAEIHKGPAASSFGVGLGGTIILKPKFNDFNTQKASLTTTHGSFGLLRNIFELGLSNNTVNTNFIYSNNHSDGYRENNEYDRESFTATALITISKKNKLTILGNYTDIKAFIPSSVDLDTFNNNPRSAAFTWGRSQGFEDTQTILGGISWQHNFNINTQLNSSVFGIDKQNYEPRPFNILDEKLKGFGIRSRLSGTLNDKLNYGIGGELFSDTLENNIFENLYLDFPIGTGSVEGDKISNFTEDRYYYNLFSEINYEWSSKLSVSAGINLNQTNYTIDDHFNTGTNNTSGHFDFDLIISPKIGFVFNQNKYLKHRLTVAHGFDPPSTEETLLPDGQINPDLKPEQGWNFEIGTNFNALNNRLNGDISLYYLKVKDLLVSRRAENEDLFAINAGKTDHIGIESSINYLLLHTNLGNLSMYANTSIYQYTFDEFIDEDADFSGNKLTGVPSGVFNTGVTFSTKLGLYGNVNHQYVGRIPANDANTVFGNSYQLTNSKMGYQHLFYKKINFNIYFGVNNIFDTKYASQLQVNATGFGDNAPRFFYAGNPVNFYSGIHISYLFL